MIEYLSVLPLRDAATIFGLGTTQVSSHELRALPFLLTSLAVRFDESTMDALRCKGSSAFSCAHALFLAVQGSMSLLGVEEMAPAAEEGQNT